MDTEKPLAFVKTIALFALAPPPPQPAAPPPTSTLIRPIDAQDCLCDLIQPLLIKRTNESQAPAWSQPMADVRPTELSQSNNGPTQ